MVKCKPVVGVRAKRAIYNSNPLAWLWQDTALAVAGAYPRWANCSAGQKTTGPERPDRFGSTSRKSDASLKICFGLSQLARLLEGLA